MKLLEHAMKIVERVLERRLRTLDAIIIEKNAGGISTERQEVVSVSCSYGKSF